MRSTSSDSAVRSSCTSRSMSASISARTFLSSAAVQGSSWSRTAREVGETPRAAFLAGAAFVAEVVFLDAVIVVAGAAFGLVVVLAAGAVRVAAFLAGAVVVVVFVVVAFLPPVAAFLAGPPSWPGPSWPGPSWPARLLGRGLRRGGLRGRGLRRGGLRRRGLLGRGLRRGGLRRRGLLGRGLRCRGARPRRGRRGPAHASRRRPGRRGRPLGDGQDPLGNHGDLIHRDGPAPSWPGHVRRGYDLNLRTSMRNATAPGLGVWRCARVVAQAWTASCWPPAAESEPDPSGGTSIAVVSRSLSWPSMYWCSRER